MPMVCSAECTEQYVVQHTWSAVQADEVKLAVCIVHSAVHISSMT